jgi:IS4 transposase
VFIWITKGSVHDIHALDVMIIEAGSIYVMDRAYVDYLRLYRIHRANAYFVTRAKTNMAFYVCSSKSVDKSRGVLCDQIIRLNGPKAKKDYPEQLRRVRYRDPDSGKILVFITNYFELSALIVAAIYKSRWNVELFFKWIKQNLRIKAFYGTSENAVKTQIWVAICIYLLVAILKKTQGIEQSLSRILQVVSVNAFQKSVVNELFTDFETINFDSKDPNQL